MTKNKNFVQIEILFARLLNLLVDLFTELEIKEVLEFVDVGEYGTALETLCFIIAEENKKITKELYDQIKYLGISMRMESEIWESIRLHVEA
ncbi:MAG: hypothetical protein D3905_08370 [Candidatus Electrothrix sp. AS4_5]|nr:hypothetical protein [Candidatus Electrothrix gigas]